MSIFNTITLDNNTLIRPNGFSPNREYVFAGEITTCTGKTIADLIGWKYADISLEWDALPQDQLEALLGLNGTEVTLSWTDVDGTTASESVVPLTHSLTARREVCDGIPSWKNIKTDLRFINVHNN